LKNLEDKEQDTFSHLIIFIFTPPFLSQHKSEKYLPP
jgi:hypothetical protein